MTKNCIYISLRDEGEAVDPASAHRNINRQVPWEQGLLTTSPFTLRTATSVAGISGKPSTAFSSMPGTRRGLWTVAWGSAVTLVSVWTTTKELCCAATWPGGFSHGTCTSHIPLVYTITLEALIFYLSQFTSAWLLNLSIHCFSSAITVQKRHRTAELHKNGFKTLVLSSQSFNAFAHWAKHFMLRAPRQRGLCLLCATFLSSKHTVPGTWQICKHLGRGKKGKSHSAVLSSLQ